MTTELEVSLVKRLTEPVMTELTANSIVASLATKARAASLETNARAALPVRRTAQMMLSAC